MPLQHMRDLMRHDKEGVVLISPFFKQVQVHHDDATRQGRGAAIAFGQHLDLKIIGQRPRNILEDLGQYFSGFDVDPT